MSTPERPDGAQPREHGAGAGASDAPLLSCRGLELRYGARCLVRGLDLEVRAGERWAVVGPNGAGKSTLLLALAGARPPDAGQILLQGRPIGAWSVEALAALRAMVADRWVDPFAMDALASVAAARYRLGLHGARGAATRAQDEARAGHCLAAMDCAELAGRDLRRLSRGERQRVALAAALAQEAALVLLDEPISHQDPRHQLLVLRRLQEHGARCGTTFLGALHDINAAARFATHALLLHGDGAWQAGPAAAALDCEALSRLFGTPIAQIEAPTHRVFVAAGETPA
jgi:iron complex transport system ATP-binding protein